MPSLQNKSIIINTLSQSSSRVGTILVSLITTGILSRTLGKSGYGQFALITTTVLFFASISDWGSHTISVREASRQGSQPRTIFANAFILRLVQSIFATLFYLVFVKIYPSFQDYQLAVLLAFPLIILISLRTTSQIIHQTRLRMVIPSLAEFLTTLAFFITLILLINIFTNISLLHAVVAILISTTIGSLITLIPVLPEIDFSKVQKSVVSRIVRESLPMGFFLVVFSIYNRIDTFLLQLLQGDSATGIYVLAYKVHENFVVFAAYLMNSAYPIISRNIESSRQIFKTLFNLLLVAGLVILVLGLVSSNFIIKILGGSQFTESVFPLRVLLFATFVSFLNHLTGYTLIASGKQRVSLLFACIALVINILLNLIFIPRYSYMAAAVVTLVTESVMFLLSFIYLYRKQDYRLDLATAPYMVKEVFLYPFKRFL